MIGEARHGAGPPHVVLGLSVANSSANDQVNMSCFEWFVIVIRYFK
jgi:hypothetical protein